MSNQDNLQRTLLTATSMTRSLQMVDLWDMWLRAQGFTNGTLVDRLTRCARARGVSVAQLWNANPAVVGATIGPPPAPTDVTAPVVSAIAEGSTGPITLTAFATDNVGITMVEFLIDGVVKGSDATQPYQHVIDSFQYADGPHTLTAKAYDAAGNFTVSAPYQFTVVSPTTQAGPFDSLYTQGWAPVSDTTVYTPNAEAEPAKSTGISNVSYTDSSYGTKIYRVSSLTDAPGQTGTRMRHEYSRRQPFNCDSTKYMLQSGNGFYFVYDANTFQRLDGGVSTVDQKQFAVGTNSFQPKDPRDWAWHPTDPNKIIFFPQNDGLVMYEFDVVTHVLTTKATFTGRLGAFGSPTKLASLEGRPSDDGRYWAMQVFNGSTSLGFMTYDMQTDTITGTLVTSDTANNCSMSPSGTHIVISAGGAGLTYEQCAASPTIRGTRAYSRDFSTFKQVHVTTTHGAMSYDTQGRQVYISLNPGSSTWTAIPQNCLYMIPISGAEGPTMLIDLASATTQWNSHYSGCSSSGRPGWTVLSMWDSAVRGTRRWLDNTISLVELKANPRVFRLCDHRTTLRYTYWQEPHATISPDGLRVMYACAFGATSSSTPSLAYMVGLPSWIYGDVAPPPPANLLGNGTFDTATGWSLGASCTVTGGKLHCNNNTANVTNSYALSLPAGTYDVTYTISDFNAGNVTFRMPTSAGTVAGTTRSLGTSPAGTYTDTLVLTAPATALEIRVTRTSGTGLMDVKLDDIIINEAL